MKKFEYIANGPDTFDTTREKYLRSLSFEERIMNESCEEMTGIYKNKHADIMSGRGNFSDIIDDVTQPYYQSMLLSRKRLEQKNMQMDIQMKTHPLSERVPFNFKEDEKYNIGERMDSLKLERIYYKDGRKLKKTKGGEIGRISFLKSKVNSENDEAVCPDCGYSGKISSFIDGCDSCGSVFTVKDFEPKISGFSLHKNRVNEFYNSIYKAYGIFFAVFSLIFLLVVAGASMIDKGTVRFCVILGIFTLISSVGPLLGSSFIYVMVKLRSNIWDTVENAGVAENSWNWFSTDDFMQNLEYKIQSICMASEKRQADAFFSNSADELPDYTDVLDCDIDNVKFTGAETSSSGYHVDLSLVLRLTENKGTKIRERCELVSCSLYGKKGVVDREITTLREYKCRNCGASVNLIEGAKCIYCGTVYDYSDHNWVFDSYRKEKNIIHRNKKQTIILSLVFLLIYFVMLMWIWFR